MSFMTIANLTNRIPAPKGCKWTGPFICPRGNAHPSYPNIHHTIGTCQQFVFIPGVFSIGLFWRKGKSGRSLNPFCPSFYITFLTKYTIKFKFIDLYQKRDLLSYFDVLVEQTVFHTHRPVVSKTYLFPEDGEDDPTLQEAIDTFVDWIQDYVGPDNNPLELVSDIYYPILDHASNAVVLPPTTTSSSSSSSPSSSLGEFEDFKGSSNCPAIPSF